MRNLKNEKGNSNDLKFKILLCCIFYIISIQRTISVTLSSSRYACHSIIIGVAKIDGSQNVKPTTETFDAKEREREKGGGALPRTDIRTYVPHSLTPALDAQGDRCLRGAGVPQWCACQPTPRRATHSRL